MFSGGDTGDFFFLVFFSFFPPFLLDFLPGDGSLDELDHEEEEELEESDEEGSEGSSGDCKSCV